MAWRRARASRPALLPVAPDGARGAGRDPGSVVEAGEVHQLRVALVAATFCCPLEKFENTACSDDDDESSDIHVHSSFGCLSAFRFSAHAGRCSCRSLRSGIAAGLSLMPALTTKAYRASGHPKCAQGGIPIPLDRSSALPSRVLSGVTHGRAHPSEYSGPYVWFGGLVAGLSALARRIALTAIGQVGRSRRNTGISGLSEMLLAPRPGCPAAPRPLRVHGPRSRSPRRGMPPSRSVLLRSFR